MAKIGKLDQLSVVVAGGALVLTANFLAPAGKPISVMVSGALGLIVYILVNGLGELLEANDVNEVERYLPGIDGDAAPVHTAVKRNATGELVKVAGKAAFFLFLYLEVLDATFSFDGVIGAFAVASDPVIIGIGLGIGAMYIRSLTVFLVRKGTLSEYVYLEHGAQWAIGALAVLLLLTIKYEVPQVVTGLIGVGFIGAALACSIVRKKRKPEDAHEVNELEAKPVGV